MAAATAVNRPNIGYLGKVVGPGRGAGLSARHTPANVPTIPDGTPPPGRGSVPLSKTPSVSRTRRPRLPLRRRVEAERLADELLPPLLARAVDPERALVPRQLQTQR